MGPDGSVYVAGITSSFGPPFNPAFVLKLSPNGDLLWQRIWGEGAAEYGLGIASGSDGAVYMVGQTNGGSRDDGADMFIIKFSQDGNLLWQRAWFSPCCVPRDWERASSVAVAGDGTVYLAGDTVSFSSMREIILLKFFPDGELVW